MPLRFDVEEYLGTNSDGSRSDEFCYYCLKDGKYIVDISMWEMIDIWIKYTDKYNEYADTDYSPKELREILDKRLPTLNRWRQKQETSSLHHKMIQNIIVYINGHLTEVLDTAEFDERTVQISFQKSVPHRYRREYRQLHTAFAHGARCTSADLYGLYAKANHRANELSD